jgi:hypothetical protein
MKYLKQFEGWELFEGENSYMLSQAMEMRADIVLGAILQAKNDEEVRNIIYQNTKKDSFKRYKEALKKCKNFDQILDLLCGEMVEYWRCFDEIEFFYEELLAKYLKKFEIVGEWDQQKMYDYCMKFPLLKDNIIDEILDLLQNHINWDGDIDTFDDKKDKWISISIDELENHNVFQELSQVEFEEPYVIGDWVRVTVPVVEKFIDSDPAYYHKLLKVKPIYVFIYNSILEALNIDKHINRSSKSGLWDLKK